MESISPSARGAGGLISDDGWTWHPRRKCAPAAEAAPDILKIGDRYLVVYGATGGGLGGRTQRPDSDDVEQDPRSAVPRLQIFGKAVVVASSDGVEDLRCD